MMMTYCDSKIFYSHLYIENVAIRVKLVGFILKSKSETECPHSSKHLELIFENSLDAMLLTVPSDGRIIMANPAACKMFGMTKDELKQAGQGQTFCQRQCIAILP